MGVTGKGYLCEYACSVGVIINNKNDDYLYCVVAENDNKGRALGEVSIYAAWTMVGNKGENIGGKSQLGNWKILLFQQSTPRSSKRSKPLYGWKTNTDKLNQQIISEGNSCFWSTGKCLNDNTKGKQDEADDRDVNWNEINIPLSDFWGENWGGTIVHNSKYYFFLSDRKIIRLNKNNHAQKEIQNFKGKRNPKIILYLTDKKLYYINQNTDDIYSVNEDIVEIQRVKKDVRLAFRRCTLSGIFLCRKTPWVGKCKRNIILSLCYFFTKIAA